MSAPSTEWVVTVHRGERIIEVRYPAAPTLESLDRYETAVREEILAMNGDWHCLVDQRAAPVLDAEMSQRIGALIAWARGHGMRHSARIVRRGSMPLLQARQLQREGGEGEETHVYFSREEAFSALLDLAKTG